MVHKAGQEERTSSWSWSEGKLLIDEASRLQMVAPSSLRNQQGPATVGRQVDSVMVEKQRKSDVVNRVGSCRATRWWTRTGGI